MKREIYCKVLTCELVYYLKVNCDTLNMYIYIYIISPKETIKTKPNQKGISNKPK